MVMVIIYTHDSVFALESNNKVAFLIFELKVGRPDLN